MKLNQLLEKHRSAILERWANLIFETYAPDTAALLKGEGDRFANPVRYATICATEQMANYLMHVSADDSFRGPVEELIKIRAVQGFTASQAILFVWLFKKALTDVLGARLAEEPLSEWVELESRIDHLAALAVDIYTACRETVHQISMQQLKAAGESAQGK